MIGEHLDLETVRRFGARALGSERSFEVAWHLFLCDACRGLLEEAGPAATSLYRRIFSTTAEAAPPEAYAAVTRQVTEALRGRGAEVERDRATAPSRWDELRRQPAARRAWMIENSARFQTFALAEHLLDLCREGWSEDPVASEELAELALAVSRRLDPQVHGVKLLNDLEAEAWAAIANCRLIRSDLRGVAEAFAIAEELYEQGSGDPIEQANLLDLKASYLRDQRQLEQAVAAIDRVIEVHRQTNDRHCHGRALIKKATIVRDLGRPDDAIALLERAVGLIDVAREPRLAFCLRNDLAGYLVETGHADEAEKLLPELRRMAYRSGGRLERLRFLWTEAKLCAELGRAELAISGLRQAVRGFVDQGIHYDGALAALDLVHLLMKHGRLAEARELTAEMMPIFASRDIHHQALAALTSFRRALDSETASAELPLHIAHYLRRSRSRPGLYFDSPT